MLFMPLRSITVAGVYSFLFRRASSCDGEFCPEMPSTVAICLRGESGAPNVSAALEKLVVGPLHADVFIVSSGETHISSKELSRIKRHINTTPPDPETYLSNISSSWKEVTSIYGNFISPVGKTIWKHPDGRIWRGVDDILSLVQCADIIAEEETTRGLKYQSVVLSHLDLMWLSPHPTPRTLGNGKGKVKAKKTLSGCWIPGLRQDFTGVAEPHAWCDRKNAEIYMRGRLRTIVDSKESARLLRWFKESNMENFHVEAHVMYVLDRAQVPVLWKPENLPFRSCDCQPDSSRCWGDCNYIPPINMWGLVSVTEGRKILGPVHSAVWENYLFPSGRVGPPSSLNVLLVGMISLKDGDNARVEVYEGQTAADAAHVFIAERTLSGRQKFNEHEKTNIIGLISSWIQEEMKKPGGDKSRDMHKLGNTGAKISQDASGQERKVFLRGHIHFGGAAGHELVVYEGQTSSEAVAEFALVHKTEQAAQLEAQKLVSSWIFEELAKRAGKWKAQQTREGRPMGEPDLKSFDPLDDWRAGRKEGEHQDWMDDLEGVDDIDASRMDNVALPYSARA